MSAQDTTQSFVQAVLAAEREQWTGSTEPRTCDALGVCQDRYPRCKDCLPRISEGHASAVRILREVPIGSRWCIDTDRVVIGRCHIPRPPVAARDGETLQEALLEPRTSHPRPLSLRLLGAFWSWA